MFCRNCGTRVPDNAAFCPNCGARLTGPAHLQPAPKGGFGKKLVLIIIALIAVLAVAAVILNALSGVADSAGKILPDQFGDRLPEPDAPNKPTDPPADIPDSGEVAPSDTPKPVPDAAPAPEPDSAGGELDAAKAAYADIVRELSSENDSLQFDLINLTGGEIPELMAGLDGYYVCVYMWENGKAAPVIDYWPYGAGGNAGYEYLPGQNTIRNFNSDMAGAIVYETYWTIDGDYGAIPVWPESLCMWYFQDLNGNDFIDEDEPFLDEPVCYYGDKEISAAEYAAYQIPGDYQWMAGGVSAEEMLDQLGA